MSLGWAFLRKSNMACDFEYFMSYWNPGQKLDSRLGMIHIQNTRRCVVEYREGTKHSYKR